MESQNNRGNKAPIEHPSPLSELSRVRNRLLLIEWWSPGKPWKPTNYSALSPQLLFALHKLECPIDKDSTHRFH